MTKAKKYKIAFGILCMNLILMSGTVANSAIASIVQSFPTQPISEIQLIPQIYHLGHVLVTLFFAWLTYHMTRKNLGLIAMLLVGVFGVIPAFWNNNVTVILASMVFLGMGLGLIANLVPLMLQEYFEGEERAKFMGWATAFTSIGMMFLTAFGGILGNHNWRHLFFIYVIAFILFIVVFLLVPQDAKTSELASGQKTNVKLSDAFRGINKYTYLVMITTIFLSIIMFTFSANQSLVMSTRGRGTAYVALVTALGNIGGILVGIFLGKVRRFTKEDTVAWGFISFIAGFILIMSNNIFILNLLGNFFNTAGVVLVNATIPYQLSILASKVQFPVVISMNTLINAFTGIFAPIFLSTIHVKAGNSQFILGLSLSLIIAVILFITRFGNHVKKSSQIITTV